ncbi:TRAP transporter small permease [Thermus tenuipuniceus]|uniref:TRAP transporter small permease n=1 Tax=Thermus tenuipuniceus TaxID=2078690 RepID=UPI000CF8B8D4|nr:TRAP transporter small permease [Thermus tenuipuniceus]
MGAFWRGLHSLEEFLAKAFLILSVLTVFAGGAGRFLGHPLDWAMDWATFCFAWAVFLGADLALKEDRHVAVEILLRLLPHPVQRYLRTLLWAIIALFLVVLAIYSIQASYQTRFRSFQGIPGFSYTWLTLSVTVGSGLMLLSVLRKLRQTVRGEEP